MKILQVNSFFYNRGGDCTHMFATAELLEKAGHSICFFSMKHPLNFASPYDKYWPSYIDFKEALANKKNAISIFRVISRAIYSFEAKKCIAKLLDAEKPDIVHIHNILHHITPSILSEIKKRNIPIVLTLHDYTIICPNTSFLSDRDGKICEACKSARFFMAPVRRCKKSSLGASAVAMMENYIHRIIRVYRHVDLFLAPSDFLRKKFEEHGMKSNIVTLNNFIDIETIKPSVDHNNYAIYIGRLDAIKGVATLIQAVSSIPELRIKIVGDGDLMSSLKEAAGKNVEFLGRRPKSEVVKLIEGAMFAVVPSEWYENLPYSVAEPMAQGKPVIGARIGGIPELIEHGVNGLLFESGNVLDLQEKLRYLMENADLRQAMGLEARKKIEERFCEKVHYQQLMSHYERLLTQKR